LCDRNDLGGISFTHHPQVGGAAVFLYDGHPGGVGLAAKAYEVLDKLLDKVLALVEGCSCEDGCPSCIHSPKCGHGNVPLDKQGCIRLLQHLTGKKELSYNVTGVMAHNVQNFSIDSALLQKGPGEKEMMEASKGPGDNRNGKGNKMSTPYTSRLSQAEGRDIVVFDLETQLSAQEVGGWQNAHLMRMSLGVIYERRTGMYKTYFEDTVTDLLQRLSDAELVVGFNQKRFDYTVLTAYTGHGFDDLASLDILEEIYKRLGFRLGLGALGLATLGVPKTADGLAALRWWKEGKMEEIEKYCRMDVELTARLFDHVLEHGYLLYENKNRGTVRLPMELSLEKAMG
jgi:DEAD/DEAH box helicase domain-containing protein